MAEDGETKNEVSWQGQRERDERDGVYFFFWRRGAGQSMPVRLEDYVSAFLETILTACSIIIDLYQQ